MSLQYLHSSTVNVESKKYQKLIKDRNRELWISAGHGCRLRFIAGITKLTFGTKHTRTFLLVLYGAYDASGLIGPEQNGIAILDEDRGRVLVTGHQTVAPGWYDGFGKPADEQWAEFDSLAHVTWPEFVQFVNAHSMARYQLSFNEADAELNTGPKCEVCGRRAGVNTENRFGEPDLSPDTLLGLVTKCPFCGKMTCPDCQSERECCPEETAEEPWLWLQEDEGTAGAEECGCRLEDAGPGDLPGAAFYMCPMHQAAPDLLFAARCALADLEGFVETGDIVLTDDDGNLLPVSQTMKDLKAAIAKATPKEVEVDDEA